MSSLLPMPSQAPPEQQPSTSSPLVDPVIELIRASIAQAVSLNSATLPQSVSRPLTYQPSQVHLISPPQSRRISNRAKCLVFVKILLTYLETTAGNTGLQSDLSQRAKAIVLDCTRRNRMGDQKFIPLKEALELRLRQCVGELHWIRAKQYFDKFCRRKGIVNDEPCGQQTVFV